MSHANRRVPVVAILTCDCFDDWLDEIGVSLESFRDEMMGTWWFGYIQAFQCVGIRCVLFCTSNKVGSSTRFVHKPTGATICLLPSSKTYNFIRKLQRRLIRSGDAGVVGAYFTRKAIAVLGLGASYLSTPLFLLYRELKREECSRMLVEQYEDPRFDLSVFLGCLMNLPVFGTFAAIASPKQWAHPFRSFALRLCAGLAICAECEATRVMKRYDFPQDKVARIHYPVDLSIWYPDDRREARASLGIPMGAKLVVYHGSIDLGVKGLDVLIDAWEALSTGCPARDLRLILIGTGDARSQRELSRLLAAKRVQGVEWLNRWAHDRNLLRRYLSAADAYVFPSRNDAFGIAVIEAMACGLPVVAASAQEIPDIVPDGENSGGLVVPTEDAMALSAAIKRVLDKPQYAFELGKNARRRVEATFSMEAVGNQLRHFLIGNE